MAAFGGFRVLSADYRMPSEAFFPAALDDCVSVWKCDRQDQRTQPRPRCLERRPGAR